MDLLGLLEAIIIIGILVGVVVALVKYVPMPEIFKYLAYAVVALICVVVFFNVLRGGDLGSLGTLRLR